MNPNDNDTANEQVLAGYEKNAVEHQSVALPTNGNSVPQVNKVHALKQLTR